VSGATEGKPSESAENRQYRGYRVFSDKVWTLAACEGKMEHNRSADDKAEMAMMTLRGLVQVAWINCGAQGIHVLLTPICPPSPLDARSCLH
jgi:hypothetical protein